jgi:hypothetical protein
VSFREVLRIVRSRWYAVAAVLLVTAVLTWPVYHPAAQYEATAVVVLVPPKEPSTPNTLAATSPSIAAAGQAVDDILLSSPEAAALRRAGVTGSFTVAPYNSGSVETPAYTIPSEQLTVTGGNPTVALSEVTALITAFNTSLHSMQSQVGVPDRSQITIGQLAQPSVSELRGAKSRGLLGMMLLGIGFAIALPLWVERLSTARKARRSAKGAGRGPARGSAKDSLGSSARPATDLQAF